MTTAEVSTDAYTLRLATSSDIDSLVLLAADVQAHLISAGSLQILAASSHDELTVAVNANNCLVLVHKPPLELRDHESQPIGSVILEPLDKRLITEWELGAVLGEGEGALYLHALRIHPRYQGHRLGHFFLTLVQKRFAGRAIVLDCWDGNHRLQRFYNECRFTRIGAFPEEDWLISVFWWKEHT